MPPRKSTASTAPATPAPSDHAAGDTSIVSTVTTGTAEPKSPATHKGNRQSTGGEADGERSEKKKSVKNDDIGIDDLLLPRTLTSRLSRGTLPPNTSIQRDALLALTKSATVFISYLAHTANSLTSRKTIQSQDILDALRDTELWSVPLHEPDGGLASMNLGERVRAEVEQWEDEVRGKRKGYRERVKARESGGAKDVSEIANGEGDEDEGRGPTAKRVRRSSADGNGDASMADDAEGDEDAAAAQLRGEEAEAAANGDATETDPEAVDDDEEEEDEGEDEDELEEGEGDDVDEDEDISRDQDRDGGLEQEEIEEDPRRRTALAPNGRVEVGSDEESD